MSEKEWAMKRKSLIGVGILAAAGLIVWSLRFDLAVDHIRARSGNAHSGPASIAWAVLDDFADRPELEVFVREQLMAAAETVRGAGSPWEFDYARLLELARHVYERQPGRVDAAVVGAGLIVECLPRCSNEFENGPTFVTWYWSAQVKASDAFAAGMRLAAIAVANYRPATSSAYPTDSFIGLAGALATTIPKPDPELARSVAAFTIAANPDERRTGRLASALDRIAGPEGGGTAWAMAVADAPAVDLPDAAWNAAVDALTRAPAPQEERLAEALLSQCVHRSAPPKPVDDGCVHLGLAWGAAWAARLRTAASQETSNVDVVRTLLSAHERESTRTWQSVIADWSEADPTAVDRRVDPGRGERVSAMTTSAYQTRFGRRDARDVALLLAAGGSAFPAVEAQYRSTRHPGVMTVAAFVLSKGSPQRLSSAVMDRIEHFRPLALSFVRDRTNFDGAAYYAEGNRVAVGLLALEEKGRAPTRIHPLILALSIPEPGFTKYASAALRETLDADEFADALFGFLAVRDRYLVSEVNVYRQALTSYEGVAPAIEANLARLVAAAGGRPERVPWILKLIGISALGKVGGSSARRVLDQYASDTDSYLEFSVPEDDPDPDAPAERVEKRFDALVASAIDEIDSRHGREQASKQGS
jgi:hypothetical protein